MVDVFSLEKPVSDSVNVFENDYKILTYLSLPGSTPEKSFDKDDFRDRMESIFDSLGKNKISGIDRDEGIKKRKYLDKKCELIDKHRCTKNSVQSYFKKIKNIRRSSIEMPIPNACLKQKSCTYIKNRNDSLDIKNKACKNKLFKTSMICGFEKPKNKKNMVKNWLETKWFDSNTKAGKVNTNLDFKLDVCKNQSEIKTNFERKNLRRNPSFKARNTKRVFKEKSNSFNSLEIKRKTCSNEIDIWLKSNASGMCKNPTRTTRIFEEKSVGFNNTENEKKINSTKIETQAKSEGIFKSINNNNKLKEKSDSFEIIRRTRSNKPKSLRTSEHHLKRTNQGDSLKIKFKNSLAKRNVSWQSNKTWSTNISSNKKYKLSKKNDLSMIKGNIFSQQDFKIFNQIKKDFQKRQYIENSKTTAQNKLKFKILRCLSSQSNDTQRSNILPDFSNQKKSSGVMPDSQKLPVQNLAISSRNLDKKTIFFNQNPKITLENNFNSFRTCLSTSKNDSKQNGNQILSSFCSQYIKNRKISSDCFNKDTCSETVFNNSVQNTTVSSRNFDKTFADFSQGPRITIEKNKNSLDLIKNQSKIRQKVEFTPSFCSQYPHIKNMSKDFFNKTTRSETVYNKRKDPSQNQTIPSKNLDRKLTEFSQNQNITKGNTNNSLKTCFSFFKINQNTQTRDPKLVKQTNLISSEGFHETLSFDIPTNRNMSNKSKMTKKSFSCCQQNQVKLKQKVTESFSDPLSLESPNCLENRSELNKLLASGFVKDDLKDSKRNRPFSQKTQNLNKDTNNIFCTSESLEFALNEGNIMTSSTKPSSRKILYQINDNSTENLKRNSQSRVKKKDSKILTLTCLGKKLYKGVSQNKAEQNMDFDKNKLISASGGSNFQKSYEFSTNSFSCAENSKDMLNINPTRLCKKMYESDFNDNNVTPERCGFTFQNKDRFNRKSEYSKEINMVSSSQKLFNLNQLLNKNFENYTTDSPIKGSYGTGSFIHATQTQSQTEDVLEEYSAHIQNSLPKNPNHTYNLTKDSILYENNMLKLLCEEQKNILKSLKKTENVRGNLDDENGQTCMKRYRKGHTKIFKLCRQMKKKADAQYRPREETIMDRFLGRMENGNLDDCEATSDSEDCESVSTPTSYITDDTKSDALSTGSIKLTEPQKLLRRGINKLSKDKSLLFSKFEDTVPKKFNKSEIRGKICNILMEVMEDVSNGKSPSLKFAVVDMDNCIFKDGRYQIIENPKLRVVSYKKRRSQSKFNLMLFILNKIRILLETNTKLTKREIYYQLKTMIGKQYVTDTNLNEISRMLDVGLWTLNIISQKGLVFGNLKLVMTSGEIVNCNVPGTVIPVDVTEISEIQSRAYFILVVEKESIFHKLLEEELPNRLTRPFILITGKGFPDLNTQLFVKKLWMVMSIPVFILVDADPHGIAIMLNYRHGSIASAHISEHLAIPKAKWLGVFPSEVTKLSLASEQMSEREKKMVDKLLRLECVRDNEKVRQQLEILREKGVKAGIEGLVKSESFLSNFYLSRKFFANDVI